MLATSGSWFCQCTFILFLNSLSHHKRTNLMKLRSEYKDEFQKKHGVKLGLMSGFVKVG